ncbi:MAG: TSUP family transporter [Nitrososphaerales archaeon]
MITKLLRLRSVDNLVGKRRDYPMIWRLKDISISTGTGFFSGFLAGLVGIGGAELRIAFLMNALKVPIREMVYANLMMSLMVSSSSFVVRLSSGVFSGQAAFLALAMIVGSLPGGYLGAIFSHRISERKLKVFLALMLSIVILRLLMDFFVATPDSTVRLPLLLEIPLSIFFGFVIGMIAGGIGVAGGEYRIPILIFVFGFPITIAGTVSQLVSIPTILIALLKHRAKMKGLFTKRTRIIVISMGLSSVLAVILSTLVLLTVSSEVIRVVFVGILLYTTVQLVRSIKKA